MENNYGILLVLLFPAISGIVGFCLGKKNKETRNDWIDIVMIVELVMLGYLGFLIIGKKVSVSLVLSDFLGLGFSLTIGVLQVLLGIVTTIVFGVTTQFMKESMKKEEGSNRFYLLLLCMHSMVLGAFMANNLFNFFMFATGAFLLTYPLIMHRQDKQALKNAGIYISFLVAAIAVILTGVVIVFGFLGSVSYSGMYSTIMSKGGNSQILLGGMLVFAGFAVFSGMFPVQLQMTRGCSYGLIEVSAVLAAIVSKLGIYGMLVLAANLFVESAFYGRVLLTGGLLTAIWGLLITLTSTDIRKILMGLDVAVNGFNILGTGLISLCGTSNAYAIRSAVYMMLVSALCMLVLYMVALEQIRKMKTYEIKGLIASGKGNRLLTVVSFLACAGLGGVPGTAGFLAHSMLFKTIFENLGWKWLITVYIILWAFLMTAVTRVFMKLFVSRKEEAMKILSTQEEVRLESGESKEDSNPYRGGEILLLLIGIMQIVVGVFPRMTIDKMEDIFVNFCHGERMKLAVSYFTVNAWIGFGIALVLCILLYVNLVHGILLRAIKNKKNKELQGSRPES